MYLAFLKYWTATLQKGIPENIGQERWRTMDTWDLDDRLTRWHDKQKKQDESATQPKHQPGRGAHTGSNHAHRYGSTDYQTAFDLVDALAAAGGLNGQPNGEPDEN